MTPIFDHLFGAADALRHAVRDRLAGPVTTRIAAYRGYGNATALHVFARVLRDAVPPTDGAEASAWARLVSTYKRFETDEIPHARVRLTLGDRHWDTSADDEGYVKVELEMDDALATAVAGFVGADGWLRVHAEILAPAQPARVVAELPVLVPPASAKFGVISDVDDTIIRTDATDVLRAARELILGTAKTRPLFPGVGELYAALRAGASGAEANPIYYVSSSPWNLFDLLDELFVYRELPRGPLILRDWDFGPQRPTRHWEHKVAAIQQIMASQPALPFLLIGDSGQEDPEIYAQIIRETQRVPAAYIRDVSGEGTRRESVRALAKALADEGGTLVLVDGSADVAEHARRNGWMV